MSETLYRIKTLEWKALSDSYADAEGLGVGYVVKGGREWSIYWSSSRGKVPTFPCDSLEHGKQLAQQHWEATLATILEPVETAEAVAITPTEGHHDTQQGRGHGDST